MIFSDILILLAFLMSLLPPRACPKQGKKTKKPRKPIQRKARFRIYEHPGKAYKLEPTENIRRKAEECRARQIAAANPAELRFAGILNQLGIPFEYQVIFHRTGSFICVDFVVRAHRVAFEVDGKAAHASQKGYDIGRDKWLASQGFNTIRIDAAAVFRRRTDTALLVKRELGL
jgi:very-short-patch-repair endonuclease